MVCNDLYTGYAHKWNLFAGLRRTNRTPISSETEIAILHPARTHTHSIHPMRVAWRVTFPHLGSAHKVMHNPENVFVVPDKYTARRRVSEVSGFRTEIANGILHRCVYAGISVHAIRLWPVLLSVLAGMQRVMVIKCVLFGLRACCQRRASLQ